MKTDSMRSVASAVSLARQHSGEGTTAATPSQASMWAKARWFDPLPPRPRRKRMRVRRSGPSGAAQPSPPNGTAAVEENGEVAARPFTQLLHAQVPGWKVVKCDHAAHTFAAMLNTSVKPYLVHIDFNPIDRRTSFRVRINDVHLARAGEELVRRFDAELQGVRVHWEKEAQTVFIDKFCEFFEGVPAVRLVASVATDLRGVLEDSRLEEALWDSLK